jgi:hypothetical protein
MNFPRLGNIATIMALLGNNPFIENKRERKTNFIVEKAESDFKYKKEKNAFDRKQQKENRKKKMKRKKRRGY